MNEMIENTLGRLYGYGKTDLIMAALEVLNSYGAVLTENELIQYLTSDSVSDNAHRLTNIYGIVNQGLNDLLLQMQLTIEGETGIKIDILNNLKLLETWEDHESVLKIISGEPDPTMALADLLEMVDGVHTWSDFSDVIKNTPTTLIERLQKIHSDADNTNEPSPPPIDMVRQTALQRHLQTYINSLTRAMVIEDQTMIGTPFTYLVDRYKDVWEQMCPMAANQAAIDIVGASLISDTPLDDFTRKTKDNIEQIYSDSAFVMKVALEMDTVLKKVMGNG